MCQLKSQNQKPKKRIREALGGMYALVWVGHAKATTEKLTTASRSSKTTPLKPESKATYVQTTHRTTELKRKFDLKDSTD
jgi:hypothetical protein